MEILGKVLASTQMALIKSRRIKQKGMKVGKKFLGKGGG